MGLCESTLGLWWGDGLKRSSHFLVGSFTQPSLGTEEKHWGDSIWGTEAWWNLMVKRYESLISCPCSSLKWSKSLTLLGKRQQTHPSQGSSKDPCCWKKGREKSSTFGMGKKQHWSLRSYINTIRGLFPLRKGQDILSRRTPIAVTSRKCLLYTEA